MCIGERMHTVRFEGKVFGQVQGDAAAGSLLSSRCISLLPFSSAVTSLLHRLASSCFLLPPLRGEILSSSFPSSFSSFSPIYLSFCLQRSSVGAARFVSFFVSGDKPMVRSRRSRRPTAYTRTRQLLRTTRHIVSGSPPSLSFSLFLIVRLLLPFSSSVSRSAPGRIAPRIHSRQCAIRTHAEAVFER